MSGITAQQWIRKTQGIVVARHVDGAGVSVVVTKNDNVVKTYPGDNLGTAAYFVFLTIWQAYESIIPPLFSLVINPAFSFISPFNVDDVLAGFERAMFEEQIMPELEKASDENYRRYAKAYREAAQMAEGAKYAIYDVLVRLFVYVRTHNFSLNYINWKRLHPIPIGEALSNLGAYDSFIMDGQNDPLLIVVKRAFPNGGLFDHEGQWIYVRDRTYDILSVIGGSKFTVDDHSALFDGVVTSDKAVRTAITRSTQMMVDQDLLGELCAHVEEMMGKPHQIWSEKEKSLSSYPDDHGLIGPKGIGRTALKGLKAIIGDEVTIPQAMERLARYIRSKSRLTEEQCLRVAAAKLSNMASAFDKVDVGGQIILRGRVDCTG